MQKRRRVSAFGGNAVRPGLATTGGPLLVASSPYARKGELWNAHRKHYGPKGDSLILVAQGASRDFNPSLPQRVVDRAFEILPPRLPNTSANSAPTLKPLGVLLVGAPTFPQTDDHQPH
jgi:hypothetical protein